MTTITKRTAKSLNLLEQALKEWAVTCPGAGWEHHNVAALVSLAMTPGMQELLTLASEAIALREAEAYQQELNDVRRRTR